MEIYRNTYGNRGIGNLGRRGYGVWKAQFEEKSIGIHMGIRESVTLWGGEYSYIYNIYIHKNFYVMV